MKDTTIGTEIKDPNQKFIYNYDFNKNWSFLVELINVSKEENPKLSYPAWSVQKVLLQVSMVPKDCLGAKFADVEEKYDLTQGAEGFAEKDEEGEDLGLSEEGAAEESEEDLKTKYN